MAILSQFISYGVNQTQHVEYIRQQIELNMFNIPL